MRDPRLIDFDAGRWEGQKHAEIGASGEYQRFIANPVDESIPGGEKLALCGDTQGRDLEAFVFGCVRHQYPGQHFDFHAGQLPLG